jgi:thioesterase-3
MASTTTIKVRGYHLDMFRHVNNARYLEFLEEGRWAFFEENPHFSEFFKSTDFTVVNINISYRNPATSGDTVEIRTALIRIGAKSGILRQEIFMQETHILIAEADVTFVMVDQMTKKARPFAGDLLGFLETLLDRK